MLSITFSDGFHDGKIYEYDTDELTPRIIVHADHESECKSTPEGVMCPIYLERYQLVDRGARFSTSWSRGD